MAHDHSHLHSAGQGGHTHSGGTENRRALATALAITAAYTVAEVIGGLMTGSLALLADAGHMLSDNFSLGSRCSPSGSRRSLPPPSGASATSGLRS